MEEEPVDGDGVEVVDSVDDRNPRFRAALEELDATVAALAADMLTGGVGDA